MTKKEREELKKMSVDAYGKDTHYTRIMRKGEYKIESTLTSNGKQMQVKRWYPVSSEEVRARMEKIITDRAAAKAAAELKKGEKSEKK